MAQKDNISIGNALAALGNPCTVAGFEKLWRSAGKNFVGLGSGMRGVSVKEFADVFPIHAGSLPGKSAEPRYK